MTCAQAILNCGAHVGDADLNLTCNTFKFSHSTGNF